MILFILVDTWWYVGSGTTAEMPWHFFLISAATDIAIVLYCKTQLQWKANKNHMWPTEWRHTNYLEKCWSSLQLFGTRL